MTGTRARSFARRAALSLGADPNQVRWLGGSTNSAFHLGGPELVIKVRIGAGAVSGARREVRLAQGMGMWTSFVAPAAGDAVLPLDPEAAATVFRLVRPGEADFAGLGRVVSGLHSVPAADAAAAGVDGARLDDLGDVVEALAP